VAIIEGQALGRSDPTERIINYGYLLPPFVGILVGEKGKSCQNGNRKVSAQVMVAENIRRSGGLTPRSGVCEHRELPAKSPARGPGGLVYRGSISALKY
jgi:hypothetical protein